MRKRTGWIFIVATGLVIAIAPIARATTLTLDAASNVVELADNTTTLNNAVSLVDNAGPVTIQVSGNATFGSQPGEVYNGAVVVYRDLANAVQYAAIPMNGSKTVTGSHYTFALITDQAGSIPGNTGTVNVVERDALNNTLATRTIFAGSTSPAQPGPAELSSLNTAMFNDSTVPHVYRVSTTGDIAAAPGQPYGSVIVQYRDATNGISYDSLPIGTSRDYIGYRFRIYFTDDAGATADNSGTIDVTVVQIPEPTTLAVLLPALAALVRRRRRH